MNKPDAVTEDHLVFLDNLRTSGAVNMFGARPHLMVAFPGLSSQEAKDIHLYWMETFPREGSE